MARGRSFMSQRTGGPKRLTEWSRGPFSSAVQVVTAGVMTLVDNGIESSKQETVVRIRGELSVLLTLATAIGDGFTRGSAGIGIVSADAFAIGATAIPSPEADADWPGWMWYQSWGALIGLETTEVGRTSTNAFRIPIDTKAMRKIGPNEVLFAAVAFAVEIGPAEVSFVMNTRTLYKLA